MKKIIEVRESWRDERSQFQEGLRGIIQGLEGLLDIPDVDAYRLHLEIEFEKKIERPLAELRKQLERAHLDVILGALSVMTTLQAGTIGALLLAAQPHWLVTLAALVLGGYTLFSTHKEKTAALKNSPLAYLMRLERELSPSRLANWVGSDMQHFQLGPRFA
uniref:Uncharacterized protein n=1 Tax=Cystobacterineae bacterium TaxID=1934914 RepID=A0A1P8VPY0_9BACT|nr:uncharacterized protein [Cystobacterineae bacterium]